MKDADTIPCSHCGEEISRKAKACRYCGSDDQTGWSEVTYMDGIDYSDADDLEDNYADGLKREGYQKAAWTTKRVVIILVALSLMVTFVFWLLRGML